MNCDQAFDLMTDPALDDSMALHEHLDVCGRCQQMYETLSPALGLFAPPRRGAPVAFDEVAGESTSATNVAERVAVSLSQTPSDRRPRRGRAVAIYAAAASACFATALGMVLMFSEPSVATPLQAAECTWIHQDAIDEDQTSNAMVLSCVACHLPNSME